jgi:hypothetical protein
VPGTSGRLRPYGEAVRAFLVIVLLIVMGLTGFLPARRIAPARLLLAPIAFLLGVLEASIAGMITALFPVPILASWLIIAVAVNAVTLTVFGGPRHDYPLKLSPVACLLLCLVIGYQLRGVLHANYGYDARAIWFAHARWLWGGHSTFATYVQSKTGSLREYPYLGPSAVATVWRLGGLGIDYRAAQLTITACNAMAVLCFGGLVAALPSRKSRFVRGVAALCALALTFIVLGDAAAVSTSGYMDLLWSALAAAAVVSGLVAPVSERSRNTAMLLLVIAAQVKTDAVPVSAAAAVLIVARHVFSSREEWPLRMRRSLPLLAGTAIGIDAWTLITSRVYGVTNYLLASGGVHKFVYLDKSVTDRIDPVSTALRPYLSTWPLAGAVGLVGALLYYRRVDRSRATPWLVWIVAGVDLLATAFGFLVNPFGLDFEIATSITRVTLFLRDLGYLELACWVPVLVEAALRRDTVSAVPKPAPASAPVVLSPGEPFPEPRPS